MDRCTGKYLKYRQDLVESHATDPLKTLWSNIKWKKKASWISIDFSSGYLKTSYFGLGAQWPLFACVPGLPPEKNRGAH